jgi:hypothetical protein
VLNFIEDLTPSLRAGLSDEECYDIFQYFQLGMEALQSLQCIRNKKYGREAIGDQKLAVTCLFSQLPQYGASRWHSLQLVEKTLKCYLVAHGQQPPKNHNIVGIAEQASLAIHPKSLLDAVQCEPSVRYGEVDTSLSQAIAAHHSSLEICRQTISQMCC